MAVPMIVSGSSQCEGSGQVDSRVGSSKSVRIVPGTGMRHLLYVLHTGQCLPETWLFIPISYHNRLQTCTL